MALAFDIECIGEDLADMDPEVKDYLVKNAEKRLKEGKPEDPFERLALSPVTGRVVSIACWDTLEGEGLCLLAHPLAPDDVPKVPNFTFRCYRTEREVISKFWDVCTRQRNFISYNGRSFDLPYLIFRSAALGLLVHRPLAKMKRYGAPHVDIKDSLENYGAMRMPWNFDLLCRSLGVPSPKKDMKGDDVEKHWRAGEQARVGIYNCGDVVSLVECARKLEGVIEDLGTWFPEVAQAAAS